LRCLSCDREGIIRTRDRTRLDFGLFERIVGELSSRTEFKTLNLIGGGEPLMSPDFHCFTRYAKAKRNSISIHTSTNGLFLDSDEKRANLLTSGLDCMKFTISGSSQKSYPRYHRGGDFHKALCNMRRLIEQREKIGERSRPFVIWKYLLFNWNDSDEDTQRAIRLSEEIGADRLSFVPTYSPITGTSLRYLLRRIVKRRGSSSCE
jgi:organic radical activating enzyme